jgi:hypothetical protein
MALGVTDRVWTIGDLIRRNAGDSVDPPEPTAPNRRKGFRVIQGKAGLIAVDVTARAILSGHWTVIGCRATQLDTTETCALLQRPSSISPCRRAADHQVREVACIGIGVPTPALLRETTQAEFSTIRGLEKIAQVRDCHS